MRGNGRSPLTKENVLAIVHTLASWETLTWDEAVHLLTLMDYPLDLPGWQTELQRFLTLPTQFVQRTSVASAGSQREKPFVPAFAERKLERSDFYAHISLPPNYIERPEVLTSVRTSLFSSIPTIALASAVQASKQNALHGMGGIGKSVIARALCNDPSIQAAFPDGILWVTLGQTPELIPKMREWVNVLGGTIREAAPTVDSLKNILAKLLKDRACLLILDDVWQHRDVSAFQFGLSHCHLLLITRDVEIAREFGAKVYTVPSMTPAEATALLEGWADGQLAEADPEVKSQIVKQLGNLPLAVKLAGAQLRRKRPDEWLRAFDVHKLKSPRIEEPHDDLELTLKLSINELDDSARRLYVALAIFTEDEAIPQVAIERLWQGLDNLDSATATELLDDLAARALLDVTSNEAGRTVQLHSLLRELLNTELGNERATTHRALLNVYRSLCQGMGWHTADDDGYLYHHLAYHLSQADMYEELQELFADQQWMHARFSFQDAYYGYLGDLMLAWQSAGRTAKRQIEQNQEPDALSDVFRCMLIWTRIRDLPREYIPELIVRAVEVGLWTVDRALWEAGNMHDLFQQELTCALLLHTQKLNSSQVAKALELGQQMLDQETDEYVQRPDQQVDEYAYERVRIVVLFLPFLDSARRTQLLEQELQNLSAMENELERARILSLLLPHLDSSLHTQLLQSTLDSALDQDYDEWLDVLAVLAPHLSTKLLEEVLKVADELKKWLGFGDIEWQEIIATLAPHITREQRTQVLETALVQENVFLLNRMLVPMIPYLSAEQQTRILDTILNKRMDDEALTLLITLAPYLSEKQCDQVLSALSELSPQKGKRAILAALAPRLTFQQLQYVLEVAQESIGDWELAWILASLSTHISGEQGSQLIKRVLEIAQTPRLHFAPLSLLFIAPHLLHNLEGLHGQMSESELNEMLRAEILVKLAPICTEELLGRMLASPFVGTQAWLRICIWAAAARVQSPEAFNSQVLENELEIARSLKPQWKCALALAALVPLLSIEQQAQLFEMAKHLSDEWEYEQILVALAPYLTVDQRSQVLENLRSFGNEWGFSQVIYALAPYLTITQRSQILEFDHPLLDEFARLEILSSMFPLLTTRQRMQIFEATISLADEWKRMQLLATQAPYLTVTQRVQVLEIALNLENKLTRPPVLASLLPYLLMDQHAQAFDQVLKESLALPHDLFSISALTALLPFAPDQPALLKSIWSRMVDFLLNVWGWSLADVLQNCFVYNTELFAPSILSSDILETIASHIIEICKEWRWL